MEFVKVGEGPSGINVTLDRHRYSLSGLEQPPRPGTRFKVKGVTWEIAGVTDPPIRSMAEWIVHRVG